MNRVGSGHWLNMTSMARRDLPSLDPIVNMAVRLFECPAAAVNLIGDDHVFLASSHGIGECDLSRDVSFCADAINQDEVMVVEDATLDPRFHDNPIVNAGMIRFYAGIALKSPSGHALGALCLIDNKPRAGFSNQDRARLKQLAGLVSDKLELRRLEAIAAREPNRFEASAATSPKAIICFDDQAEISTCNAAACLMFDRSLHEMVGQSIDTLIAENDRPVAHAGIKRVLGGGAPLTVGTALTGLRRDGQHFPAELHWSRWHEGDRMHFSAIVQDMTEKHREHDALYYLANYDTLTDLPNRNMLHRRIDEALAKNETVAVIYTDLDGLTDINNTLGHAAGDRVLTVVTQSIRAALPDGAFLARVGDAEFATLLENRDPGTADEVARAINSAVAEPIVVDGHEVRIAGNCGIAIAPNHGDTAEELMSSAELALFHARSTGRGGSFLFIPNLRAEAVARRMYDAELHRAFEREEFVLFYQPQVRLEITENIILHQQERVLTQLEELRRVGVRLSFDDFGTGFASLNLLRTFPVTQIKIDKSFTQVMQISQKDRVIVAGLIDMAKQLDLEVVAEGVEHQVDAKFLRDHGCHKGQGFLFGRPLPASVFVECFLMGSRALIRA